MLCLRYRLIAFPLMACLSCAVSARAWEGEKPTVEQMRDFLLKAKVIERQRVGKGLTGISGLTLSDGRITQDAAFQTIDEERPAVVLSTGQVERNFKDSYKFNIAAYELSRILGLGDMMPVTVERRIDGVTGSLSWWLPFKIDEEQRMKKNIQPPDVDAFNKQYCKMLVFSELVCDIDRNLGNILYSEDWHMWMIDFSRAFRVNPDLATPKNLIRCWRPLLEKLRQLDVAALKEIKDKKWLSDMEIRGMMARRDKIVACFENLIAKKGEKAVIYD